MGRVDDGGEVSTWAAIPSENCLGTFPTYKCHHHQSLKGSSTKLVKSSSVWMHYQFGAKYYVQLYKVFWVVGHESPHNKDQGGYKVSTRQIQFGLPMQSVQVVTPCANFFYILSFFYIHPTHSTFFMFQYIYPNISQNISLLQLYPYPDIIAPLDMIFKS